jgi:NAD(P)-dependent dehydrogenase (short-subunit alcohol dehydrogenase family)
MAKRRKVALITGANGGIGNAVARRFYWGGYNLALTDNTTDYTLEKTFEYIKSERRSVHPLNIASTVFKPGHPRPVNECFDEIKNHWGDIDVLVNVAGFCPELENEPKKLADREYIDIMKKHTDTFAVNYFGALAMSACVAKHMLEKGIEGSIVNVASIAGLTGQPGTEAYAASKAALISLTKSMAMGLKKTNIRVNAIAPIIVDTALAKMLPPKIVQMQIDSVGRLLTPMEVAQEIYELSQTSETGKISVMDLKEKR